MRPRIMVEYPGVKFVELGTIMGERWRALTPEEKKKYEDMAAEDKIRFNNEMQKYMAKKAAAEPPAPAPAPQPYAMDQQLYQDMTQAYTDPAAYGAHGYDQHYQYHT